MSSPRPVAPARPLRLAYIMSRFPKLTETFVLNEILVMEEMGVPVEVFPLLREAARLKHAEAERLAQRAHFHPFLSWPILAANWHFLRRNPARYLRLLWDLLRGTWGSLNFLAGAAGIFPKCVRFAREMEHRGITHVHAHFANHPAAAAFIIGRLTGIPFSFTAHGSDLHVDRHMLREKVEAAAFVVAISDFNREVIVRECGEPARGKVVVIHCGVNPAEFRPPEQRSEAPFRILCVGSLEEVKGHRYLVEACRILRERGVEFQCDLIGEGPLRGQIESQVRKVGFNGDFRFRGGRSRQEVQQMLSGADAFVLASVPTAKGKREGIPVALMEAMASGLPVVASDLSGIPELVESGQNGFLVAPRDSQGLANALQTLAQDAALRARLGNAAREKVIRDFNLRGNAVKLLQKILESQAREEPCVP